MSFECRVDGQTLTAERTNGDTWGKMLARAWARKGNTAPFPGSITRVVFGGATLLLGDFVPRDASGRLILINQQAIDLARERSQVAANRD